MEEKKDSKLTIALVAVIVVLVAYIALGNTFTRFFKSSDNAVDRGEELYNVHCASCHGVKGVGENPLDMYAQDEFGYIAPPMDSSAHAWHHTDENLVQTILEGSPRNPRMAAFKNVLNEDNAKDIVEYIKSLWTPFIRENCQGPAHMNPGCGGHVS